MYRIDDMNNTADPSGSGWVRRHLEALRFPEGPEVPIVAMLRGWIDYANGHAKRYECGIGEDGVLGDEWEAIGKGLLGLLNGETGRLDCGSLDGLIRRTLTAEGFDADL